MKDGDAMAPGLTIGPYVKPRLTEDDFQDQKQTRPFSALDAQFPSQVKSQISPSRSHDHASRVLSRQSSSSELSSEIAPEIVVWTEDMDVDGESQEDESEWPSEMDISG